MFKQSYLSYLTLILFLLIGGVVSNCSRESNPLSVTSLSPDVGQQTVDHQPHFIPFTNQSRTFLKLYQDSAWVTVQDGGELDLDYDGDFKYECSLSILPGTISEDAMLTMSMDDSVFIGSFDMTFEPHGITFSQPAILNLEAKGLDLSNVDPNSIDIYYDNPDTGMWERMERDTVIVKVSSGKVEVKNARIPHFSRYALSGD